MQKEIIKMNATEDMYVVRNGHLEISPQGEKLRQTYLGIKRKYEAQSRCWAGAYLAEFLIQHPWVESLRLSIGAGSEYDDQGGFYRTLSSHLDELVVKPECAPQEFMTEGAFDADLVCDVLQSKHFEDAESDIYSCFYEDYEYEDLKLTISRAAIADLLSRDEFKAEEAFRAFFPEFTSRIEC